MTSEDIRRVTVTLQDIYLAGLSCQQAAYDSDSDR